MLTNSARDRELRVHSRLAVSESNGPGRRAVVWFQGCSLACPGCFNPATHESDVGEVVRAGTLADWIGSCPDVEGVTISGGEPFEQLPGLVALLGRVRKQSGLSVLVFTGFSIDEIYRMSGGDEALAFIDVLVAGRYQDRARLARSLRGSANKRIHFLTDRYGSADIDSVPVAEVVLGVDGSIVVTGIEPLVISELIGS